MMFPFAVFALLSLASASDVLEFTDSDFSSKIVDHDVILVEFFAPWCGHCKRLAPEYEKAATSLKKNDPPVSLAKVDCTANTEVCGKYGVSGYPTLKIFKNGEMAEDYNGPREADGIVKTMRGKAGPASKELTEVGQAEKFLDSSEYGVVGFFKSADSDLAKTFQKVASAMSESINFAHTYSGDINKKYGYDDDIVLFQPKRLHSKFEESKQKYTDDATVFKLKSWIADQSLGLCAHRTSDNADKLKKPLIVAYYDVDYTKNVKGTNYWRNRVMKVGKKLKDAGKSVYFAISSKDDFSHELNEFGITSPSDDKPTVAARDSKDQKFIMTDEFSMDNLEKFANELLDGKLEPYLKSEPVPTQDQPVKVLVGKNFQDIVTDDKDVLIEFYAPWCGHCKQLEPKYTELAEKLADEPELVIAKMDATANDVPPPYEVQGFPTIYFKPKGSTPKKYQGGREVTDFVKYLAKEAKVELKGYNRDGKKKKSKKTEL
ncbi:protein disulfide-isomerase A3-like [Mercenaria mercenaria]|uniref:protein disulfide-isomerase A3-like n=1 Tax=Mercenaria mercenaria TaxID=6596 RepID=UPI00234F41EB|nr:protein disulfide-isomerase A3-like [Mercenaria mercenaria]